ncbi:DnaJ domain-containing protein [Serpentinicella sp. ANB-PHB4]|uniref:J domain-containing protein n=1 Tax=Serpentinicella sp. ANB-PHB4 TaxID=3074076 RepID=UPI00285D1FC7|nr:DnaJ domain-containing protein [Serpentinicella sp. ANB-PHB4]MDR5658429.1 DnaJ domain-containing protein [Serpentinicella sp. ANB-PHB4]
MTIINKLLGKIIYSIGSFLAVVLDILIGIIETVVLTVRSITKGCFALISMGGCLFILLFAGPLGLRILAQPGGLFIVLFLLIFPVLGASMVSYLRYLKYIWTEFLFNLGNYLNDKKKYQYKPLREFQLAYRRAEEERRKEEQRRRYEEQKEWAERFARWHQQNAHRGQGGYSSYGGQGNQGFSNPYVEFKNKYEKSCDTLDVPYDADKNKIKLAYRKKAKIHHPDLNKDKDTTKAFQEITNAYEFLNEDNIQRYKSIKNR